MAHAVGGAFGGLSRSLLECPLEVYKVRLQARKQRQLLFRSPYRGIGLTVVRNTSVIALFWFFVATSREVREAVTSSPAQSAFLAGGGCSTLAWLIVYPVDVLKSQVQAGEF